MGSSTTIARFSGIDVIMHLGDHNPPHIHASHGEFEVVVDIQTDEIREGSLPPARQREIWKWVAGNRDKLLDDWEMAFNGKLPNLI